MIPERCILGVLLLLLGQTACTRTPAPAEDAARPAVAAPEPGEPVAAARALVDRLARGDFPGVHGQFDATMKQALPIGKLEAVWKAVVDQSGEFGRRTGERQERFEGYDIVFVTCEFGRTTLDVKVVLGGDGKVAGLFFVPTRKDVKYEAPDYARTEAFEEREVWFGDEQWRLPGTLSLPRGDGPFPVVVLVHGSGPNDRDETVGAAKPFKDLAWGIASRGIAVLRYEKRTRQHKSRMAAFRFTITTREETTDDVLHAAAFLRKTERIDPRRIFVLGHSLGGKLVPRVGKSDPDLAGLIVLAGTTRRLEDIVVDQFHYLFSLDGDLSDGEKSRLQQLRTQAARVKKLRPGSNPAPDQLPLGLPASYWLDLQNYRPPEMAARLPHPMLILQGGRDYQVTLEDFRGWKRGLGGRKHVTFKVYPKLNHLFIAGEGKSTPEEYDRPGHVDAEVVEDIAGWILQRP